MFNFCLANFLDFNLYPFNCLMLPYFRKQLILVNIRLRYNTIIMNSFYCLVMIQFLLGYNGCWLNRLQLADGVPNFLKLGVGEDY